MYTSITLEQAETLLGCLYNPHYAGYQILLAGEVLVDIQLLPERADVTAPDYYTFGELLRLARKGMRTLARYA